MARSRIAFLFAISAAFLGSSVEVTDGSRAPNGEPPAATGDPLDTAPEGEPICTREGFCWEFPYTPASFESVHASAPNALWAAGSAGTILRSHSRGEAWRAMPTGTTADLHGVFGADLHTAWAVGDEGTVLAFDGKTWSKVPVPVSKDTSLRSVWAASPTDAWVVGSERDPSTEREIGVVLHYDGKAWSRLSDRFAPLTVVHGDAKSKEVWIAGGTSEGPQIFRFDGLRFTDMDSIALLGNRRVYGRAAGLWVTDRYDVIVTTGDLNTSTIARYTGEWKIESSELLERLPVKGVGRGPGGAPWVVASPPLKSDGKGAWIPALDRPIGDVAAIWAVDDEVTVFAGANGMLDVSGAPMDRPGRLIATNLDAPWVLAENGLFRYDAEARRWTAVIRAQNDLASDRYESFVDAVQVSDDDIVVVSSRGRFLEWKSSKVSDDTLPISGRARSLTKTKAGDVWALTGQNRVTHRTPDGKYVAAPKCTTDSDPEPYGDTLWRAGDDVFVSGYRGVFRIAPSGACTLTPRTNVFSGADREEITSVSSTSASNMWLTTSDYDASGTTTTYTFRLYRFDGSTWKKMFTRSEALGAVRVVEGGGVFVLTPKKVTTWNGSSLVDVVTGLGEKESELTAMWGKTVSEARFLGPGGRILKKK